MKADRSSSIPPLSPETIQALGEPESVLVAAGARLDHRIRAWLLGRGVVTSGGASSKRETEVKIWILPEGVLLTNITARQTSEGGSGATSRGKFHETPEGALDWLIQDGNGKLGTASRDAWVMACNRFPPMHGMDVDDAPDDPLAMLNQGAPEMLVLGGADGTPNIALIFTGPFRIYQRRLYQRPFEFRWLIPGLGGPPEGSLMLTFAAGAELLTTTPGARWNRIHRVLRRKHVLAPPGYVGEDLALSTYLPDDGSLSIATADLVD